MCNKQATDQRNTDRTDSWFTHPRRCVLRFFLNPVGKIVSAGKVTVKFTITSHKMLNRINVKVKMLGFLSMMGKTLDTKSDTADSGLARISETINFSPILSFHIFLPLHQFVSQVEWFYRCCCPLSLFEVFTPATNHPHQTPATKAELLQLLHARTAGVTMVIVGSGVCLVFQ